MKAQHRSIAGVTVALVWAGWVVTHYYAWPLTRPEIADGIVGSSFPYGSDAVSALGRALAGAGLTLWAAWGFGSLLLRKVAAVPASHPDARLFQNLAERISFVLGTGLAALSMAALVLAWLGVYRAGPLSALVATGVLVTVPAVYRACRRAAGRHVWMPLPGRRPAAGAALPALCVAAAMAFAFVGAAAPEIEYDALWYHLWLPQQWLQAGEPVDIVHEYVSLYPLFWQLVYGIAMVLAGPHAAKLLHFVCLPLVALAAALLARRIVPRANAWLAAALAAASPLMIWEATTAYNDLALAWYVTLAVYALLRLDATGDRRWLLLAGVTAGSALATKHLALLAAVAVASVSLARLLLVKSDLRRAARAALLLGVMTAAVPAPWYARAYAQSGNPFFPDLYSVFGARPPERWSPGAESSLARFKARFGRERSVGSFLGLPWDMTVHGEKYGGTFGPLFLILVPPALVGGRLPRQAWLVASGAAVYLALWASPVSSFQMRFVVPLVPAAAALAAAGAATLGAAIARSAPRAAGLVMVTTAALLIVNLPPFTRWHERARSGYEGWLTHVVRQLPARVVLGAVAPVDYLQQSVPSFQAWQYINRTLPPDSRILTFSGGDHLYSARDRLWSDATAAHPLTWSRGPGDEHLVQIEAERRGITHVLFDARQLAAGLEEELAIATESMRRCCLRLLYDDGRFQLYAFGPAGGP